MTEVSSDEYNRADMIGEQARKALIERPSIAPICPACSQRHIRTGLWIDGRTRHTEWTCVAVEDLGEDDMETCQMCQVEQIRYVQIMEQDGTELRCGCICAGHMEQNIPAAEARRAEMVRLARIRKEEKRRAADQQARREVANRKVPATPDKFDPSQRAAISEALQFYRSGTNGRLWVGGLAGTGKTTVLAEVKRQLPEDTPVLAPTNKAAGVIGQKLDGTAETIHRAIKLYRGQAVNEETGKTGPVFHDKPFSARVVLLDESSMVEEKLGADLQAVCNQIIAFGDPGQLGPVNGQPFCKGDPDVLLTENHRQKGDDAAGILRAAYAVRNGAKIHTIDSKEFQAFPIPNPLKFSEACVENTDVILVRNNVTRHNNNDYWRHCLGYPRGTRVRKGELLVAQRHIRDLDIIKSDRFQVLADWNSPRDPLVLHSLDTKKGRMEFHRAVLDQLGPDGKVVPDPEDGSVPFFAFGYTTTVHMAQGSEVPNVLIVDDYYSAAPDYRRWLYTAISRGAKRVTLVTNNFPIRRIAT